MVGKHDPVVKKIWKTIKGKKRFVGIRKSGRWKFLKSPTRSTAKPKRKKHSILRQKGTHMSRGKNPIASVKKIIRIGAFVAPAVSAYFERGRNMEHALELATYRYTGWSRNQGIWTLSGLVEGYGPYIGATIGIKGAEAIGRFIKNLF